MTAPALLALALGCANAPRSTEIAAPSDCEFCSKPLVQGSIVETVAAGGETHRYRCVHCALSVGAAGAGDFSLVAPTPTGETVRVARRGGVFTATPSSAVFLILPEADGECLDRHKAFTDEAALRAYVDRHGGLSEAHPKAWTLAELESLLEAGRPR